MLNFAQKKKKKKKKKKRNNDKKKSYIKLNPFFYRSFVCSVPLFIGFIYMV